MQPLDSHALTPEQQAIVGHNTGPALVFAVAGAGKTTAMVHRIARLVQDGVFKPEEILATSFNKDANDEIRAALRQWPVCAQVQVRTLHALGYLIIRQAHRRGHLPYLDLVAVRRNIDTVGRQILYATLAHVRQQRLPIARELDDLDHDDFLNYVGACKGNLEYADPVQADLPPAARHLARQAHAPRGVAWYRDLYRAYESVRHEQGLLTFDDMLMTGWEMLVRHSDVLESVRRSIRCVLVDEFQDVNLAQVEMLDLLTAPHRNYMAIGDDDQTIYEWRGASPRHILGYRQRYHAKVYYMTDNFRCEASHIALANRVVRHNRERQEKLMHLTRGFGGVTQLHVHVDADEMGLIIARTIRTSLEQGLKPADIAILVRVYAQTPVIEQHLIGSRIPYVVAGGEPFYARPEVAALLHYCRVAQWERDLQSQLLPPDKKTAIARSWHAIYNRPMRYIPREVGQRVLDQAMEQQTPFTRSLIAASREARSSTAERMLRLADDLAWLASQLAAPAGDVLRLLEARLGYVDYLREHSGFDEVGAAKAANVAAFLAYAEGKGNVCAFLRHVDGLAAGRSAPRMAPSRHAVTITSIYKAKGLEWPLVIVPNCNQGTIPLERSQRIEEERRLLYVALTRSSHTLHLHTLQGEPLSAFLQEAQAGQVLDAVNEVRRALFADPAMWELVDYVAMAINGDRLDFGRYFVRWWDAPAGHKRRVASAVASFYAAAQAQGVVDRLDVRKEYREIWQQMAGPQGEAALELAGLSEFFAGLQERKRRRAWWRR